MIAPTSKTILACALAALVAAPGVVDAHGSMSIPKPTFTIQGDTTQFAGTVDSSALTAPAGMSFTTDPESNTKAFTAAIKTSAYKSVRDLINAKGVMMAGATKQCGITSATGTPQPLPAKYVEWSHGASEGFTPSHEGPCEVWCDDALAFTNDNCAKNYPAAPAELPIDHSKCVGKKLLTMIWLALHSPTWQAYINCAVLEGGSSSGTAASSDTAASADGGSTTGADATTAPASSSSSKSKSSSGATATTTTTTTTPAPTSGSDDEYDTPAPASSTGTPLTTAPTASAAGSDEYAATPTATTSAPATSGATSSSTGSMASKKCKSKSKSKSKTAGSKKAKKEKKAKKSKTSTSTLAPAAKSL